MATTVMSDRVTSPVLGRCVLLASAKVLNDRILRGCNKCAMSAQARRRSTAADAGAGGGDRREGAAKRPSSRLRSAAVVQKEEERKVANFDLSSDAVLTDLSLFE